MALIKCPECGNDISSYASVCIHCGYPIKEMEKQSASPSSILPTVDVSNTDSSVSVPNGPCPICLSTSSPRFNTQKDKYQCGICGYEYGSLPNIKATPSKPDIKKVRVSKKPTDSCPVCKAPTWKLEIDEDLSYCCSVCGYKYPFIDGVDVAENELEAYIKEHSFKPVVQSDSSASIRLTTSAPWETKYYNYPCPYCGLYKVRPAKWEDKRLSIAFWGALASSKTGARYKCEACNRMWS